MVRSFGLPSWIVLAGCIVARSSPQPDASCKQEWDEVSMLQLPAHKTAMVAEVIENDKITHTSLTSKQEKDKTAMVDEANAKPQAAAEAAKQLPANAASVGCDLMVLTTFLSTKKDWQRKRYRVPTFKKMQQFYESAHEQGVNVTVLYDELPEDVLRHETEHFKFQHVDLDQYDAEEGVNDVRFNLVRDVVQQRPEWRNVFLVDLFDVKVGMNPCGQMEDGRLYVGDSGKNLSHYGWMEKRFEEMGGKYEEWFRNGVQPSWLVLNAGITGGSRGVFLRFLQEMTDVLRDPELTTKRDHREENVNMGALNYVVRVSMNLTDGENAGKPSFHSGLPVHSNFKQFETDRKDVWFIHK